MTDIAIRVEDLSKQYRIGGPQARYKTIRGSLTEAVQAPFRRVSKLLRGQATGAAGLDETIWALKDVSFEVERGEVVGIIGRNGAGKTTLLKVLSRITEPTEGYAEIHGRVGSLLEVGTGFHPELTGRENIYLNGAILGMRRAEIERKFDEIVAFAEIEKFMDTPVKYYSSGMYVRLAFAVAAHLEPEILLVDEVLAVGDAAFQKKCLGKMGDISRGGRTVLFVSHNMVAITNLCGRVALLESGRLAQMGEAVETVQYYLDSTEENGMMSLERRFDRKGNGRLRINRVVLSNINGNEVGVFRSGEDIRIILEYTSPSTQRLKNVLVAISIDSFFGERVCQLQNNHVSSEFPVIDPKGHFICSIPRLPLIPGLYRFTIFVTVNGVIADWVVDAGNMRVEAGDYYGTGRCPGPQDGKILIQHTWTHSS